jgi:G:T/U-mismatch repair DNA glycosylase
MIEIHPFGSFLPTNVRFVLVGTFPGRKFSQRNAAENEADEFAFSYGGRNQLWKIMGEIFEETLNTRQDKKTLLTKYRIGLMDLYQSVERLRASNLDTDLRVIEDNKANLRQLFDIETLEIVYCTGKGVADILQKWFPEFSHKIIALPSPSPAARLPYALKLEAYQKAFQGLKK